MSFKYHTLINKPFNDTVKLIWQNNNLFYIDFRIPKINNKITINPKLKFKLLTTPKTISYNYNSNYLTHLSLQLLQSILTNESPSFNYPYTPEPNSFQL